MKKFLSLLLMTVMAVTAWATTYSHTFANGELTISGGTVTLSDVSWTASSATYVGWNADKGIQLGSGNKPINGTWTLSTSAISGTVTSVKVNASIASGGNTTLAVSVGGDAFGSTETLTTAATDYTFTGSGSGEIVISFANTAKAFYIKSVEVTYSTGGDDPTPTTYNVNIAEMTNGTVVANPASAAENATVTLTVTPNTGYKLGEIAAAYGATNVALTTVTEGAEYTFSMPASEVIVTASFVEDGGDTPTPSDYIFYESFNDCAGTGGNDNLWSGSIASGTLTADNADWTFVKGSGANKCAKFGTGSAKGSAETPAIALTNGQAYTLTFKAAAWNGNSEQTTLNLSATGASLSEESVTLVKGSWSEYTVTVTATASSANIKFEAAQASSNRFFLDEVMLVDSGDTPVTVAAPTFDPAASAVAYGTTVTITAAEGCVIAMTTDGTNPTESETAYVSDGNVATYPITQEVTIKAAAVDGDLNYSNVVTAAYTLILPDDPTFSPAAGAVEEGTTVTITSPANTTVTYTTDGSDPIESSTALTAESNVATVTVNEAMTIKAVTMDENGLFSEVATAAYTIQQSGGEQPLTAQFDYDNDYATLFPTLDFSGISSSAVNITEAVTATVDNISVTISPATGNTPNRFWTASPRLRMYSGTMTVTAPNGYNLTAIAFNNKSGNFNFTADKGNIGGSGAAMTWSGETPTLVLTCGSNSQIKDMTVTIAKIEEGAVEMPTISGTTPFLGSTEVTITAQAGDIRYTIDGTDPTPNSTLYEAPFEITATTTVKAIAIVDGKSSNVASMTFEALPSVENIADFYTQQPSNTVAFANSVIAIAQTSDKKYTYAQDASSEKGLLIFNNKSGGIGVTYSLGEVIPAGFQGNYTVYRNQPELTNATGFTAATSTVEVTPIELTPDQVTADNIFRYAVIKGATLTSDGKIVVGENSVIRFNRFGVNDPEDLTKTYDIYGVTGIFDENLQFMPIRFEEVVEETGVTLAEALAGENGDVKIISDMQVVVANNAYAIVSDGEGNWLKLTNASELEQGQVVTNVTGAISGLELNPVMTVTGFVESDNQVEVTTKQLNLGTIHRTALTELKPNEVADFVGYYNAQTSELCAFSSGSGLHIAMATDNMVGEIVAGKQQTITGVVELKAAWDAPTGAPARVAIDDDQAFENIRIDATAASVPTGVETVKAIDGKEIQGIYNVNGQQVKNAQNGVYIIRYTDGTAAKVRF